MIVQDPLHVIAMLLVRNNIKCSSSSSCMRKKSLMLEEKKDYFPLNTTTEILSSSTKTNNNSNNDYDKNGKSKHKVSTFMMKMMPNRTKKKVSFCYLVDVIETLHHMNYSKEERLKSWYSKSDYDRMELEFKKENRTIGKLFEFIIDDCCGG
mmetsp:Transcript_30523/g.33812  ORF Transcript_30523/g.33812 Transcript_30523/m.33812 type:complete len:152 (+) Transcript_30523:70-525(+)